MAKRTSNAETVLEHLLERIRNGEFGPGARLPTEKVLQQEVGVSRLSLREGLARASALGIINVEHGKGAFVREGVLSSAVERTLVPLFPAQSAKSMESLIQARVLLESEQAALAASHHEPHDILSLRNLLHNPGEALLADASMAELDCAFHREVARIAGNAFLRTITEALVPHTRAFFEHYVMALRDRSIVIERHWPIVDAIASADAEKARQATRAHVGACEASVRAYRELDAAATLAQ
ncbi:MAG: FadR/GntR family transcriptional regulator [Opitutales bacterium]